MGAWLRITWCIIGHLSHPQTCLPLSPPHLLALQADCGDSGDSAVCVCVCAACLVCLCVCLQNGSRPKGRWGDRKSVV